MNIHRFISENNLLPGDAIELVCPDAGFPKHYALYKGTINRQPSFIANTLEGIVEIKGARLSVFWAKYKVTSIERFKGTLRQRAMAVKRAVSRIGEKAYNIVFNNCEHFKNWVLYNESKSKQVLKIGSSILIGGVTLYVMGVATRNKGLQKVGLIVLSIPLIIILLAIILWRKN